MALWTLSGTTQVSRYQKKHSPTHIYRGHQPSLICFLHLLRSLFSFFQCTCLTVFFHNLSMFSLVYLLAWHPSLHIPYISSLSHCLPKRFNNQNKSVSKMHNYGIPEILDVWGNNLVYPLPGGIALGPTSFDRASHAGVKM